MDFARISYLAGTIPANSQYLNPLGIMLRPDELEIERFVRCYRDLSFGHHYVRAFIETGKVLPPDVHERELIDLYWFLKRGEPSTEIVHALSLDHPANRMLAKNLQAFLITGATPRVISKKVGIPADVIRTYEQLFFNVRDRQDEALLIANIVYPESRVVEFKEGYLKDVDPATLILRAGYNNGLDDAAYFAGLRIESVESLKDASAKELANRLESAIMANGYFLARNGFLSQRSSHGVSAARGLLVAAKQSGMEQGDDDDYGATSLGDAMMQELQRVKGGEMQSRIAAQLQSSKGRPTLTAEEAEVLAPE